MNKHKKTYHNDDRFFYVYSLNNYTFEASRKAFIVSCAVLISLA
jgi:hypothetical protein